MTAHSTPVLASLTMSGRRRIASSLASDREFELQVVSHIHKRGCSKRLFSLGILRFPAIKSKSGTGTCPQRLFTTFTKAYSGNLSQLTGKLFSSFLVMKLALVIKELRSRKL